MRVFLLAVLSVSFVCAQSTDGTIGGTVTDTSGAGIPKVTLTAKSGRTGVVTKSVSNETGSYLFPLLLPGEYEITAEAQGFTTAVTRNILLEVGARITVNLTLEVGSLTTQVTVEGSGATELAYSNASVGGVLTSKRVLDLPITSRSALGLVYTQAGLVGDNFAGARIGTLNIQIDGVNVQDARINTGVSSPIVPSVDRIEEFRVIVSPVDAEYGRGSGQIQMITRSGTNEIHGSAFWFHRNTALNANDWFNNQRGLASDGSPISPRDVLIRNQFGARVGGPVSLPKIYNGRNRTFFHFLYEGQVLRGNNAVTSTVLTETARRGLYRYFPGVQNGNANAAVPTVDLNGNPVLPPGAIGSLQTQNLFAVDPSRTGLHPAVSQMIGLTPLPNNFRFGDGLNTAGYTFSRGYFDDYDQFNVKLDHNFTSAHRLNLSYNREARNLTWTTMAQPLPTAPGGITDRPGSTYAAQLTSTLRPNLLNEFQFGAIRHTYRFFAPWETEAGLAAQPRVDGQPYLIDFLTITDPLNLANDPQGRISPNYQWRDTVSWLKGKHSVKFGGSVWFVSSNGFNSFDVMPRATIGNGASPVRNMANVPGIGRNQAGAENMLNDLTGSLANVIQALNSPGGRNPQFVPGEGKQRIWKQREFALFAKDDWKISKHLTLNLGLRYEYYGVPWDGNGRTAGLVGGSAGIFGLSGSSMADLFQPGRLNGSLTNVELVGPNSPKPDTLLYNRDLNNFGPAVGLTWALPWFGENKTVLRAGYQMGYERGSLRIVDVIAGDQPGLRERVVFTSSSLLNLNNMRLPLSPNGQVLSTVPLTDRQQTVRAFDTGLRSPYVQNYNVSITRQLPAGYTLDVRYVANLGSRLLRTANMNEVNVFENGLLEAYRITQAGGNAPLFDRLLMGLNVPGVGVVNGTTVRGSDAIRSNATFQGQLANNNVGGMGSTLNTTDLYTGSRGGLLRNGRFPENWIVANPQFSASNLASNFAASTYHSLQLDLQKRFSSGYSIQANYTWSKALGEEEGAGQEMLDSFRTLRDRSLDKRLMSFHRTHVFRSNALATLPFGKGRRFASSANRLVDGLIGGWQFGVIYNVFSGVPMDLTSALSTMNSFTDNTPNAVGDVPKKLGEVTRVGQGVVYFPNLQQLNQDPYVANITTLNNIRGRSTMRSIADSNGNLLLVNPVPGTLGSLGARFTEGPGSFRLDVNLIKTFRITERVNAQLNITADNFTNSPSFSNPTTDINSVNFGRITSTGSAARIVTMGLRLNW